MMIAQRRNMGTTDSTTSQTTAAVDRWAEEQLFEEDLRSVLTMLRPHRRERLLGWSEYRTGGAHFRATVTWDPEFEVRAADQGQSEAESQLQVPRMTDVLESILVGSGGPATSPRVGAAEAFPASEPPARLKPTTSAPVPLTKLRRVKRFSVRRSVMPSPLLRG